MKIGAQIRLLRKEKGISQDVLAQQLGITCQAVSKWENGSTMPDITMLPMIARYFGYRLITCWIMIFTMQMRKSEAFVRRPLQCAGNAAGWRRVLRSGAGSEAPIARACHRNASGDRQEAACAGK